MAQCTLVKCNAFWFKVMNSRIRAPFYIFYLNPDFVAARSLRSLRMKSRAHNLMLLASGSEAATILYDSEIWPKSVGCKIVDLRSRMRSLYPGA